MASPVAQRERTCLQCRRLRGCGFNPWVWKIPWSGAWQPTPVFLLRKISWTEESGRVESLGSQSWTRPKRLGTHTHVPGGRKVDPILQMRKLRLKDTQGGSRLALAQGQWLADLRARLGGQETFTEMPAASGIAVIEQAPRPARTASHCVLTPGLEGLRHAPGNRGLEVLPRSPGNRDAWGCVSDGT